MMDLYSENNMPTIPFTNYPDFRRWLIENDITTELELAAKPEMMESLEAEHWADYETDFWLGCLAKLEDARRRESCH